MKIKSAVIIGCGGIGQFLIPAAVKLLSYHSNGTQNITIIDGDHLEHKNAPRQFVREVGLNKAIALSTCISPTVKVIPEFINNKNVSKLLCSSISAEPTIIIPCVDNMASRKLVLQMMDSIGYQYVWLCPGNEYETYRVSYYKKVDESQDKVHPFKRYENLANPVDNIPGGCLEEQESTPQLIAANMNAASVTISMLTAILEDKPLPQEVMGDIFKLKHVAIG